MARLRTPRLGGAVDIAIIGCGIAGIAAARRAGAHGLRVIVLEAMDRPGGRAHTVDGGLGFAFDRGCQWLHSARLNPLRHFAGSAGIERKSSRAYRRLVLGGRWQTAAGIRAWKRYEAATEAAVRRLGWAGRDVAVSQAMDRRARWAPAYESWTATTSGIEPDRASTLDFANYHDTDDNWQVRGGVGAMIARLADGLPIALSSPVTAIDWRRKIVRIATGRGTLEAKAVIVTASTAALAAGRIAFTPGLPGDKRAAIEALPLGTANRIALAFDRSGLPHTAMSVQVVPAAGHPINLQIRPHGQDAAIGYVSGTAATALEAEGEAATIDFALAALEDVFATRLRHRLRAGLATRWQAEPWIGGAYSAARPGSGHLRPILGAPLADRVFFAGEAASQAYYSTAHGAFFSGEDAADAAAAAIGG